MHVYEAVHPNINGSTPYNSTAQGRVYRKPGMPVHVVQGTAGVFTDLKWISPQPAWSAVRLSEMGYGRMTFNATHLHYEFAHLDTNTTVDDFWVVKV